MLVTIEDSPPLNASMLQVRARWPLRGEALEEAATVFELAIEL